MASKPSTYINWVSSGSASAIAQPPPSQMASGWSPGEAPAAQYFNWLFYTLDQWVQWLDQVMAVNTPSSTSELNARLINGGTWSFVASSGTLSWSSAFSVAFPGTADATNQVAAGSVVLGDGAVMYINANVPFSTTANATSGSAALTNLAYQLGVVVGQSVSGSGIAANTTVAAVSGTAVTLSAAATATTVGAVYTFVGASAPTAMTASNAALVANINTVVVARRVGVLCYVGVGSGQMLLHDQEQRALLDVGYAQSWSAIAGTALSVGQAVYMSAGNPTDTGRTQGQLYPADVSVANGAARSAMAGIVVTAAGAGGTALVVSDGLIANLSGLTPGATYYVNPATPGALTTTKPSNPGQYVVCAGLAVSATSLDVNPAAPATASIISQVFSVDNYAAASEAQLATALSGCAAAGGGCIALLGPFSVAGSYTVPAGTILEGAAGATILTFGASATLTLATTAQVRDVWIVGPATASTLVAVTGGNALLRSCKFAMTSAAAGIAVNVTASGTRLYNCTFTGVAGGVATGIAYTSGNNNLDDSSVFL